MGRVVIHGVRQLNGLTPKKLPDGTPHMLTSGGHIRPQNPLTLIVQDTAVDELWTETGWGQWIPKNRLEMAGLLVGYFHDAADPGEPVQPWVEVSHVIPCVNPSARGKDYVTMSPENFLEMYRNLDQLNARTGQNYAIVGWYHTHPEEIPAVYSNLDIQTQANQFNYEYNVGLVLNPHQRTWRAYCGPNSESCRCYLMVNDALAGLYGLRRTPPGTDEATANEPEKRSQANGRSEVPGNPCTPERCDDRSDYSLISYKWYQLQSVSYVGKRHYEKHRIAPHYSMDFANRVCELSGKLHGELAWKRSMDPDLLGIVLTCNLRTDQSGVMKTGFGSSHHYHNWNEITRVGDSYRRNDVAVMIDQRANGLIQDDDKIGRIMANLGVRRLVLCDPQTDVGAQQYAFWVITK